MKHNGKKGEKQLLNLTLFLKNNGKYCVTNLKLLLEIQQYIFYSNNFAKVQI